jgi:hypothetical protein
MQEVLGIVRAARSVFIADNSAALCGRRSFKPRPEIVFFQTAVGMATQGFNVVDVDISRDTAHLQVQDATDEDARVRGVHASQFLAPTWAHFPKPVIRVTYIDKSGRNRLEATAAGPDCEEIAEGQVPFEALADRVTFRVLDDAERRLETYPRAATAWTNDYSQGRRKRDDREHSWREFSAADYSSRIAPWRTVIWVTGSPEDLSSVRIWSFR